MSRKFCPSWFRVGQATWQALHAMPYFRAKAGMASALAAMPSSRRASTNRMRRPIPLLL